ncbi:MAG TPA: cytochrome b/b6 domain-containing protein, partial [Candidatus Methylomirabilis sp.]|nr:cytochrome b/b6 domain-containing protein [Candidatus Methylomirabilis sp.]
RHPEADTLKGGGSGLLSRSIQASQEVVRFGATERAFHWAFALPFLGLLLSGLPLSFAVLRSWISGYSPEIGLRLHLVSAMAWILAPALVVVLGDRRTLATAGLDLFGIARQELSWLRQLPRWLAGLPCEMKGVGRFNAGQKLNALFVAFTSVIFLFTGIVLTIAWLSPLFVSTGGSGSSAIIGWSRLLHYLLTVLMLVPLLGHIVMATVHPRTKESLRGMLFGVVDADWARAHHPKWYAEICRKPSDHGESMLNHSQISDPRSAALDR